MWEEAQRFMMFRLLSIEVVFVSFLAIALSLSSPGLLEESLQSSIQIEKLMNDARLLEDFAFSTQDGNRVFGSPGHKSTVRWIYSELSSLAGAFTVTMQPFTELHHGGNASLIVNGRELKPRLFLYSPSGYAQNVHIVPVPGVG